MTMILLTSICAGDTYGDGIDSDCDGMDCEAESDGSSYFVACQDFT